jgi:hypothetical protein
MSGAIKAGRIGAVMFNHLNPKLDPLNDLLSLHGFVEVEKILFMGADNVNLVPTRPMGEQATGGAQ